METKDNFFDDEAFQDYLVALLCRDVQTLRKCAHLLTANDFKPLRGMHAGRPRWITAERALEHWRKYKEPLGRLLHADILEYATKIGMGADARADIKQYFKHLAAVKTTAPDAIVDKVVAYKKQRTQAAAIAELTELQNSGQLNEEQWLTVTRKVITSSNSGPAPVSYFDTYAERMERRKMGAIHNPVPWSLIDPLDSMVRLVGPKQLGLAIAPYKRGKSMFLLWMAMAYVIQRLNVLYITLEDPRHTVEDRLDALITSVPMKELDVYRQYANRRFTQRRLMLQRNLRIYDGVDRRMKIADIERVITDERELGIVHDAVLVDYDKKIVPNAAMRERRFEYEQVYQDFTTMLAKYNMIGWTAAQTQRDTKGLKILSGDRVAEDIGKAQNVTVALSLGQSDWATDAIYLFVAAHKNDVQLVGCHIIPDMARGCIYDRDATAKAMLAHQN